MNRSPGRGYLHFGPMLVLLVSTGLHLAATAAEPDRVFRAGAAVVDITPTNFPVIVNAMFEERTATKAYDPLYARCLALDNGQERVLIAVVDSCMLPRDLLDQTKRLVSQATGIPTDRMLISATHTHSAPSAMGCLGSRVDSAYASFLPGRIAEGLVQAARHLAPAQVGWGSMDDPEHTHCRRWIRRPDRLLTDPFGEKNVRANMHPGYQSPDVIGPSGPVDPALSLLSLQTPEGKPIAVLANYSMHYYESPILSSDYYGRFATKLARLIGAEDGNGPFVAMMSQGTSGDQMWMDYGAPQKQIGLDAYAQEVAEVAAQAYRKIQYHAWAPLVMKQAQITLGFRLPNEQRLAWARELAARIGDRPPKGQPEIYAKEALYLQARPTAELILQALRIGELGITAIPNEVYGITGLKIKAQSPLALTFNVELANGSEGYIPSPEQHRLGGYTTWPARTAGLETNAEPRIVEEVLRLLEDVSGKARRQLEDARGTYVQAVLAANPVRYWRLNEFTGPNALDVTGHDPALYEGNVAFYLEGPASPAFSGQQINRAPQLVGGHLNSRQVPPADRYTLELWFWNGLPSDARAITGYLLSLGSQRDKLWLGGTNGSAGRLLFSPGNSPSPLLSGHSVVQDRTWNHLVLVRHGRQILVYLNGALENSGNADPGPTDSPDHWLVGASHVDGFAFEGRIDEVAAYDYPLSAEEIARHFSISGIGPRASPPAAPSALATTSSPGRMSSLAKSPAESLASIHVPEGFAIELVASEPLISSPVAIDWGIDGKLWVVEMADYPYGLDGKMRPGGRIRYLEDTDGDGKMDKSTVFLENVNFPNGLITWRNGVIVTAAPEIFYAEDSDGDGKADRREVLFTGFREGNLQLRVNGLRWGLDNWLHCANGWSGGSPKSLRTGVQIDISGRDLRIQPDSGGIDAESGQSEFGRNPDDWGDWFGCDNSYPLFHFVLEDHYLRRNPHLAAPDAKRQLYLPANPRVYPRSKEQKRYHTFEHASHFTSACSTDFYRDDLLFPRGPDQHVFTCEPVHNLVQHLLVRQNGVSFTARRAEADDEPDFVASEDQWFRPVMARTGPDGALWVVDMYRYMIEHPDWLPPEGKKELAPFYREGADRGRIYRVIRKAGAAPNRPRPLPRLDQLTPAQLARALERSNGWVQDKAVQLLVWRADSSVVPALEELAASSLNPLSRLHALAALDGLGTLRGQVLERALADEAGPVRRHAVRLAETRANTTPALLTALVKLADDPDAQVRLQLACSLGECNQPAAGEALAQLALHDANDPYMLGALMSSAPPHLRALVNAAVAPDADAGSPLMAPLLKLSLALNDRPSMARLLGRVLTPVQGDFNAGQFRIFAGLLDNLAQRQTSLPQWAEGSDELARQLQHAGSIFAAARRIAPDTQQSAPLRAAAVRLLGQEAPRRSADLDLLGRFLEPHTPGEIQRAAIHAMAKTGDPLVPAALVEDWSSYLPEIRAAVLDELLARQTWTQELLRFLEQGKIAPLDVSVVHRDRLLKDRNESIRSRAHQVLALGSNPDRQRVIDEFRPALSQPADALRGREIFARICAVCHRLDGVGRDIGPNLNSVRGHPPEKLLTSILDPSREVEPRYLAYTCKLKGGEELYGLIASETGNGIEIKLPDGTTRAVLRSEIESLQSTKTSLMPDGLEATLSRQDIADVIQYLRSAAGVE